MSGRAYYDDYWRRGVIPAGSHVSAQVLALLEPHLRADTRCLDVGCGNGRGYGSWLHERAGGYVGVDVSPAAVQEARALGLDARVVDDATTLPFDHGAFDLTVAVEVLEHMVRPDRALAEIARVLRPGGVVLVTVPNIVFWRRRVDALAGRWHPLGDELSVAQPWRDPHLRFFTPGALGAMVAAAGFDDVRVGGHDGAFVRNLPLVRRLGRGARSRTYARLELRAPALLAARINCVATKPG